MPIPAQAIDSILEAKRKTWLLKAWDRCSIYDPPENSRSPGGGLVKPVFPDDFTMLAENAPCKLRPTLRKGEASVRDGAVQRVADYVVEVKWDQAVSDRSIIVVESRGDMKLDARKVREPELPTHLIVEADEN